MDNHHPGPETVRASAHGRESAESSVDSRSPRDGGDAAQQQLTTVVWPEGSMQAPRAGRCDRCLRGKDAKERRRTQLEGVLAVEFQIAETRAYMVVGSPNTKTRAYMVVG